MHKMNSNTKTIILVACLLIIIILSGSLTLYYLNLSANELEHSIKAACKSVSDNQWDSAKGHLDTFEATWKKTKFGWAILLDHFEIDNIDNSFTKSEKYVESEDFSLALSELEALRQYILHIPQKEGFSLENIL
ncbi:MAG: DUF4363 family protein [Ruminiclostridium sp.]